MAPGLRVNAPTMLSLHVLIVSWAGRHDNAAMIAASMRDAADRVTIVYSDPDPAVAPEADCELVRRPDELFWGDKFKACLDACDADLMLVIHADCACDDWAALASKCRRTMDTTRIVGIWAPLVDWTPLALRRTRIAPIKSTSLCIVAQTDAIVFCFSRPVIARMKRARYEGNAYGWGFDTMAAAHAYSNRLLAVVDESVVVRHPRSRGYPEEAARAQCNAFLKQMDLHETVQNRLLWSHVKFNDAAGS
jgi:hypothetical protein